MFNSELLITQVGSPTSYKQPPLINITIFLLQEYVDLSSKRKVYLAANLKIYATQIVHLKALMFLIAYFAGVCTVSTFFYISTFRISLYCNFVHCLFLYHGFVFVFFLLFITCQSHRQDEHLSSSCKVISTEISSRY